MLRQRLIVTAVFIPIALLLVGLGGWVMAVVVAAGLGAAAWEYWRMFARNGYAPSRLLLIFGAASMALARQLWGFEGADRLLTLLILLVMAWQVVAYERGGHPHGAQNFAITLAGILYIGWLGSYLISLRALPGGMWWVGLVLPAVLIADGAAYFAGRFFGRHPISPVTSPKKTWEGYIGGLAAAVVLTALVGALWHLFFPTVTALSGAIVGGAVAATGLLGDLGESMIKRSFGVKDSSHILPGHGGVFDRIDSWLFAAPIGYYLILVLWAARP